VRILLVSSVVCVLTLHPTVTVEVVRALRCRDIAGIFHVLDADVRVACGTADYRALAALAIAVLLIFSLGSVIAIFGSLVVTTLQQQRRQRGPPDNSMVVVDGTQPSSSTVKEGSDAPAVAAAAAAAAAATTCSPKDGDTLPQRDTVASRVRSALRFLALPFAGARFWWGLVPLARKTLLLAVAIFFGSRPAVASFLATVVLLANIIANTVLRPHRRVWAPPPHSLGAYRRLHALLLRLGGPGGIDTFALVANLVTLAVGPAFAPDAGGAGSAGGMRAVLAAAVIAANLPMVAVLVVAAAALAGQAAGQVRRKGAGASEAEVAGRVTNEPAPATSDEPSRATVGEPLPATVGEPLPASGRPGQTPGSDTPTSGDASHSVHGQDQDDDDDPLQASKRTAGSEDGIELAEINPHVVQL
jgi:hypothetical protein